MPPELHEVLDDPEDEEDFEVRLGVAAAREVLGPAPVEDPSTTPVEGPATTQSAAPPVETATRLTTWDSGVGLVGGSTGGI